MVESNCIRNFSLSEITSFFPSSPIQLNQYDLICVGMNENGLKSFCVFRIVSCSDSVLLGAHEIQFNEEQFNVTSLRNLKKNFFHFKDFTSFERSTFIIIWDRQALVRLKNVRALLYLPSRCIDKALKMPGELITIIKRKRKIEPFREDYLYKKQLGSLILNQIHIHKTYSQALKEVSKKIQEFMQREITYHEFQENLLL